MATKLTVDQYREVLQSCLPILVDTLTLDGKVYSVLIRHKLFNHDIISTIRTQPTFSQKVQELINFLISQLQEGTENFQTFCDVLNSTGQAPISNMLKRAVRAKIKALEEEEEEEEEDSS